MVKLDPAMPNATHECAVSPTSHLEPGIACGAAWRVRRPLPAGPLDILGDIHGEIDSLRAVMGHLGYADNGDHPEGRRLVLVGDLVDRGPNSPGVVRWVAQMMNRGTAFAVMGNHDLSCVIGRTRRYNAWMFGHEPVNAWEKPAHSQREREEIQGFLRSLPLVLERPDLRVVHACWDAAAIAECEADADAMASYRDHAARIERELAGQSHGVMSELSSRNTNPVKRIAWGPEGKVAKPFLAAGKWRSEGRLPWWNEYDDEPFVVFGHYWRLADERLQVNDGLFNGTPLTSTLGKGRAMCIDYSVGGRWVDRKAGNHRGPFIGRLAALRWPERELVFDDGERCPVIEPSLVS